MPDQLDTIERQLNLTFAAQEKQQKISDYNFIQCLHCILQSYCEGVMCEGVMCEGVMCEGVRFEGSNTTVVYCIYKPSVFYCFIKNI